MTIQQNYSPYYNDFDTLKNYIQILFRPGYAVQARELTQLQTMLQVQFERVGRFLLQEGSMVTGGLATVDSSVVALKLRDYSVGSVASLVGQTLIGRDSKYKVLSYVDIADSNFSVDNAVLICSNIGGDIESEFTKYVDIIYSSGDATDGMPLVQNLATGVVVGDPVELEDGNFVIRVLDTTPDDKDVTFVSTLPIYNDDNTPIVIAQNLVSVNKVMYTDTDETVSLLPADFIAGASLASIASGVYFAKGVFNYVDSQTIPLTIDSNQPTCRVGLKINESIVTEAEDITLTDPARGANNYAAPGAHRYKIQLVLTKLAYDPAVLRDAGSTTNDVLANTTDPDFIELIRLEDGVIKKYVKYPILSELEKTLARRTYDESGDYTVRYFPIKIDEETPTTPNDNVLVGIEPGKAYIKGYEFETIATETLKLSKARTTSNKQNDNVVSQYGSYFLVSAKHQTRAINFFVDDSGNSLDLGKYAEIDLLGGTFSLSTTGSTANHVILTTINTSVTPNITTNASIAVAPAPPATSLGTFNVTNYYTNVVGKAKIRYIQYDSMPAYASQSGVSNYSGLYRIYVFDIKFRANKSIKDVKSLGKRNGTSLLAGINLADTDGIGYTNTTKLYENGYTSLIYPLSQSAVKTLRNDNSAQVDCIVQRQFDSVTADISNTITLTGLRANEQFIGNDGTLSASLIKENFVIIDTTSHPRKFVNLDEVTVTVSSGSTVVTIGNKPNLPNLPTFTPIANNSVYVVLVNVSVNSKAEKRKTLFTSEVTLQSIVSLTSVGVSLGIADAYRITNFQVNYSGDTTNDTFQSFPSWASYFELDNGQKDDLYDHARLKLIPGVTLPANFVTGSIAKITLEWFSHTGEGFFSVDSYDGATTYENIPTYTSNITDTTYTLRDALDFRPRRQDAAEAVASSSYTISVIDNPFELDIAQSIFDNLTNGPIQVSADGSVFPAPNQVINVDFDYYLPRIDYIVVTSDRRFQAIYGTPDLNPKPPRKPDNAMLLYMLTFPAYTFGVNDILINFIENKRYTMRDIGNLEKRIDNLEYYTTLSLIEEQTRNILIVNDFGEDRFKRGFLVDSFNGHSVGNVWDRNYKCSIDFTNKELRAPYNSTNTKLIYSVSDSNIKKNGDLITLKYTPETFINQPLASKRISVNPYDVVTFIGTMELTPAVDMWIDSTKRPDVNINLTGENDAWEFGNTFNFTEWGEWSTRITQQRSQFDPVPRPQPGTPGNTSWSGGTVQTTTNTRSGVQFTVGGQEVTQSLGESIVDISMRQYIRPQTVQFYATGLKPNTSVSLYFDGIRQNGAEMYINGLESERQSNGNLNISTLLKTDISGIIRGRFRIPEGQFRTGLKRVTISDSPYAQITGPSGLFNNPGEEQDLGFNNPATTIAETTFSAQGLAVQTQETVVSTRVPEIRRTSVSETQVTSSIVTPPTPTPQSSSSSSSTSTSSSTSSSSSSRRVGIGELGRRKTDPLAQTFFVDSTEFPEGVFLDSIDLWFALKPKGDLPVWIEIRPTVNGFPHSNIVLPFSTVYKQPSQVSAALVGNRNFNTTEETNFKFASPVYLAPGEYALVVLSNDAQYEVLAAAMGELNLGTLAAITKQPYSGSLFKSQNASTWTPEQNEDLKFRLNRCKFVKNQSAVITYNNEKFSVADPLRYADTINITSKELSFSSATVTNEIRYTLNSATPVLDSTYRPIKLNSDIQLTNRIVIGAPTNTFAVNPTFQLRQTISTTNDAISPIIDLQYLTLVGVEVVINNPAEIGGLGLIDFNINNNLGYETVPTATLSAPTSGTLALANSVLSGSKVTGLTVTNSGSGYTTVPTVTFGSGGIDTDDGDVAAIATIRTEKINGDVAKARYITRRVTLDNAAKDLKVYVDIHKKVGSDVRIYYKAISASSITPFDQAAWVEMVQETPRSVYSVRDNEFKEFTFKTDLTNSAEPFNTFAVKIVMTASNPNLAPRLKNLRVIAVDTTSDE